MHFINTYWLFFCVECVCYAFADHKVVSYEGAQLWRAELRGASDIITVKKLIDYEDVSAWSLSPSRTDFLVLDKNIKKVKDQLAAHNLSHTVLIADIQQAIDAQKVEPVMWNENSLRIGHRLNWNSYPTWRVIEEYYNFLAEEYSSICKLQTIGYTTENRPIQMLNITNGNPKNKIVMITGGVHGREWVSITSALYILHNIVTKFDHQPSFMKSKNWLIIPVLNPDGYRYTQSQDRLWRKNRRKSIICRGADINRNFELDWGIAGITINDECNGAYAGPYPFSESETVALRDVLLKLKKKPCALIDIHSYGNLILYPWSARSQTTRDVKLHKHAAEEMVKAIKNETKQVYSHGPTYHKIYPATGSLLDWMYSQGIQHSYAIEARDTGKYGFLIPQKMIEETAKDIFAAVKALAKILDPAIRNRGEEDESWF